LLVEEDTKATGRQSNPKNMGYLREYHKDNWQGTGDYLGYHLKRSCTAVQGLELVLTETPEDSGGCPVRAPLGRELSPSVE